MTYTIEKNPRFGSFEVTFSERPEPRIRESLKALRFRWHKARGLWYGFAADEASVRAAIDGAGAEAAIRDALGAAVHPSEKVNKYGVRVGDIFRATWGYEQTNNDFFQVIELVGVSSVRVREVNLPVLEEHAVTWGSADYVVQLPAPGELLPPAERSFWIKDQARGDLKRLKSWAADGVSDPCFHLASYANAHLVRGESLNVYESWYA